MEIDLIFELWDVIIDQAHFTRVMMIGMFTITWTFQALIYFLIASRLEESEQ